MKTIYSFPNCSVYFLGLSWHCSWYICCLVSVICCWFRL